MASTSVVDYYNSRVNFDKLNPLIRSAYNTTFDFEEYKQKLLTKVVDNNTNTNANITSKQNPSSSFLDSIEELRREQRLRLTQVEHDYHNQKKNVAFDVPYYAQQIEERETLITSKPPLPTASRRSPSPVFIDEEQIQHEIYHRPLSANITQRYDDDDNIDLSLRRTNTDIPTTSHVKSQIENMWDDFELEDYIEQKKDRRPPTTTSWAGRVTKPAPFSLTNSTTMGNVHRKKCMHQIQEAKLQKEIDDEIMFNRSFKANPVPAHVRMPLYEQLRDEQRVRREQLRTMTKEYLNSISKPFGFESREKNKQLMRRHSYSGGDTVRSPANFKAKPLPDFYYRTSKDIEQMKENSLYRSIKKEIRAKELLRQSRLPSSMQDRQHDQLDHSRRSMSANDLARLGIEEYTFKPQTNGYYVPNFDKLHSKFARQSEKMKRTKSGTRCKPFLLYTNLIPSKKDKVLDDIRIDEEQRYLQSFQIKGKQLPTRSTSGMDLSSNLQQSEPIPTKTTESQRLRESIGKKKRREHEVRNKFEEKFQRSRSAREKRLKEKIVERAKLNDKSTVYKAKKEEHTRKIRHSIHQKEDDYARNLDQMNYRVERRPLLLEQRQRDKAVQDLERKIRHAMHVAKITEKDLMRQQFNPPNVKVTTVRTDYSS